MIRRRAFCGGSRRSGDRRGRRRGRGSRRRVIGDTVVFRTVVGVVIIVFRVISRRIIRTAAGGSGVLRRGGLRNGAFGSGDFGFRRILIIHDFNGDGDPAVQMLVDFRSQLCAIFLEQGVLRRINEKGYLAAFGEKAHLDRAVDEIVGDRQFILSPAAVAFQKFCAVLVRSGQPDHVSVPVQIHLHLRIDGEVNGGIDAEIILVIAETEKQEKAGGDRGDGAAHQAGDAASAGGLRLFHQHGIFHGLADFVVEIGRFPEPALLIQKNRIAGMAFHYHVFHCAAPPFMTCLMCPRMISYPLV